MNTIFQKTIRFVLLMLISHTSNILVGMKRKNDGNDDNKKNISIPTIAQKKIKNDSIFDQIKNHKNLEKFLNENPNTDLEIYNYGATPLIRAANMDKLESLKILIEHKADVNGMTNNDAHHCYAGHNALDVCRSFDCIKLLIENKSNLTNSGAHPLERAAFRNDIDSIKLLIEYKANVNVLNKNGILPLVTAAKEGNLESCQMLMNYGADITKKIQTGNNVLMQTALWGQLECLKYLITSYALKITDKKIILTYLCCLKYGLGNIKLPKYLHFIILNHQLNPLRVLLNETNKKRETIITIIKNAKKSKHLSTIMGNSTIREHIINFITDLQRSLEKGFIPTMLFLGIFEQPKQNIQNK